MDVLPGWKTIITAGLKLGLNVVVQMGWLDADPEAIDRMNDALTALIGMFLAVKVNRNRANKG